MGGSRVALTSMRISLCSYTTYMCRVGQEISFMLDRGGPPWARRVRWPIPYTKADFCNSRTNQRGLLFYLRESTACPFQVPGRYTALFQVFVLRPEARSHGPEKVEDLEGMSLYLDIVDFTWVIGVPGLSQHGEWPFCYGWGRRDRGHEGQ
jgi:hypothetical protein